MTLLFFNLYFFFRVVNDDNNFFFSILMVLPHYFKTLFIKKNKNDFVKKSHEAQNQMQKIKINRKK